jgi:hypothetical protein
MKRWQKTLGVFLFSSPIFLADGAAQAEPPSAPAPPNVSKADPPTVPPAPNALPPGVLAGNLVPRERVLTWDLNIDGAYGRVFADPEGRWTMFGRVRAGLMYIRDSLYFSLGPTYEISKLQLATFGLQGEVMHIETGLWCQLGALVDVAPHPGLMVAAGWSLFGVEFQAREYDRYGIGEAPALYGKIRIPIGVIARAFK